MDWCRTDVRKSSVATQRPSEMDARSLRSDRARRMLGCYVATELNELDEIRHLAFENSKMYNERTKAYHDKKIISRHFEPDDQVLFYNSRLTLFPGKLKSRWSGLFTVTNVQPSGAITLQNDKGQEFTVNGQRVKHYWIKPPAKAPMVLYEPDN